MDEKEKDIVVEEEIEDDVQVEVELSETEEIAEDSGKEEVQPEEGNEETDAEFTDGKPKQAKSVNKNQAWERRVTEAYEKGKKETEEKSKMTALIGLENHFTGEEITDEADAQVYRDMLAMKKDGLDPVSDYANWQKKKYREQKAEVEAKGAEQKKQEWFVKDRKDFEAKHPDIKLASLLEDPKFEKFSKGKVGQMPLAEIYDDFAELVGEFETTAEKKAESKLQRQQAYSKSSVKINSTSTEPAYYSMEQIKKMSAEEISKNYDKVMKSYEHHTQK